MNIMQAQEIFEIRSCIDILVNAININTIYKYMTYS